MNKINFLLFLHLIINFTFWKVLANQCSNYYSPQLPSLITTASRSIYEQSIQFSISEYFPNIENAEFYNKNKTLDRYSIQLIEELRNKSNEFAVDFSININKSSANSYFQAEMIRYKNNSEKLTQINERIQNHFEAFGKAAQSFFVPLFPSPIFLLYFTQGSGIPDIARLGIAISPWLFFMYGAMPLHLQIPQLYHEMKFKFSESRIKSYLKETTRLSSYQRLYHLSSSWREWQQISSSKNVRFVLSHLDSEMQLHEDNYYQITSSAEKLISSDLSDGNNYQIIYSRSKLVDEIYLQKLKTTRNLRNEKILSLLKETDTLLESVQKKLTDQDHHVSVNDGPTAIQFRRAEASFVFYENLLVLKNHLNALNWKSLLEEEAANDGAESFVSFCKEMSQRKSLWERWNPLNHFRNYFPNKEI